MSEYLHYHDVTKYKTLSQLNLNSPVALSVRDRAARYALGYPVRRMYPQTASERLTIASDTTIEDLCDDHEYRIIEKKDICTSTKRLLPDRTHAAHNRANEKLVRFIVKQRMVEPHLLVRIHSVLLLLPFSKHLVGLCKVSLCLVKHKMGV